MNFGKYPVVEFNLANKVEMCGDVVGYHSAKVRVPWNYHGETMYEICEVDFWKDSSKLSVSSEGSCIHASFGYDDVMEMLEGANAPILDEDSEVVIIIHDGKRAAIFLAKTASHKDIHCQTVLEIDADLRGVISAFEALN